MPKSVRVAAIMIFVIQENFNYEKILLLIQSRSVKPKGQHFKIRSYR